jgi:hypothetical protein
VARRYQWCEKLIRIDFQTASRRQLVAALHNESKISSVVPQTAITVLYSWEQVILLCGLPLPQWLQQAYIKVQ